MAATPSPPPPMTGTPPLDALSTLPPAPAIIHIRENGRWVEKELKAGSAPVPEFQPIDEVDILAGELSDAWYNGRGKTFAAKWVPQDVNHGGVYRTVGWEPVDPKHYVDSRYPARELAGVGKVIMFNNLYLCEMPHQYRNARRALITDRITKAYICRIFGMNLDTKSLQDGKNFYTEKHSWGVEDLKSLSNLSADSAIAKQAESFVQASQYMRNMRNRALQLGDARAAATMDLTTV